MYKKCSLRYVLSVLASHEILILSYENAFKRNRTRIGHDELMQLSSGCAIVQIVLGEPSVAIVDLWCLTSEKTLLHHCMFCKDKAKLGLCMCEKEEEEEEENSPENYKWTVNTHLLIVLCCDFAFDCVSSAWSFSFFIFATMADNVHPRCYPLLCFVLSIVLRQNQYSPFIIEC